MQYNKINSRYVLLLIGMGLCFVAASTDLSWAQGPSPLPPGLACGTRENPPDVRLGTGTGPPTGQYSDPNPTNQPPG